jgi:DNA-binding SARP family transcriptional activator/tetratricopeptide (TPR) repeat protein
MPEVDRSLPEADRLRFQILGGLSVVAGERTVELGTPKQRAVLAVLLLERDRVVSVDRLLELLWNSSSDKALSSLQVYVSRLRTALEPGRRPRDPATVLVSQPPGYRLAVARADVDLYRFEDSVALGLDLLRRGDHVSAGEILSSVLADWSGGLLPEFGDEPFVIAAAGRAEGVRLSAVEGAAEARLASGDHLGAVALLEPAVEANPARERLNEMLALALYRGARQSDALRVVDACRRVLAETTGLDPGPSLRRLESDLLAQSPALDWTPPRQTVPEVALATPVGRANPGASAELIGRRQELAQLQGALADAEQGRGGVAIVLGEPGIGKTRLAEALVEQAGQHGVNLAWTRCPESRAAPPFWAVTHLADQLMAAGVIDAPLGAVDGEAAVHERFGLYRAVADALAAIEPATLLVIDDLQWADPDSLRLLEHVAADLGSSRTLVLATMRPLADDSPEALVDCLAEVARVSGSTQVALVGLGVEEVAGWLATRHDGGVRRDVAELVHERTGGNPLFIKEVTEMLAAEGRLDDPAAAGSARTIPPGVQFVVRRRVSRLPSRSQQLLAVAAVIGPTIDPSTLAAAFGAGPDEVLELLMPALDAGLLVDHDGEIGFSHALVADALASELNAVRRATIHAAAARSLADRAGPRFGIAAAAIAHHALEGILAGTGELAIEAGTIAAAAATARFAHEDAAAHWGDVAAAVTRSRPHDVAAYVDALIEQARALTRVDMVSAAKPLILTAAEAAAAAGLVDRMVSAGALVSNTHVWTNEPYGVVDASLVGMLEGTLSIARQSDQDRAVLLGALAAELVFADRSRHLPVCAEAESAARASGDPDTLARVLNNLILPNRPDDLELRRERALEIVALAERHSLAADLLVVGHHHLAECHLELAEIDEAREQIRLSGRALESIPGTRLHSQQYWIEAAVALIAGDYEAARELGNKAHDLHRRGRHYNADVLYLGGMAAIAIDHGGFEELAPIAVMTAGSEEYPRATGESMAFAMLEIGQVDVAGALVAPFGPSSEWPDDWTTLFCQTAALHVRVELDDRAGADAVAELLAPYPNRWTNAGSSPICMGVVGLALARQSAMCGDDDLAAVRFAEALRISERMGAPAWTARGLVHHGSFLAGTGDSSGAARAYARAAELASRHGLPYVQRRLAALAV